MGTTTKTSPPQREMDQTVREQAPWRGKAPSVEDQPFHHSIHSALAGCLNQSIKTSFGVPRALHAQIQALARPEHPAASFKAHTQNNPSRTASRPPHGAHSFRSTCLIQAPSMQARPRASEALPLSLSSSVPRTTLASIQIFTTESRHSPTCTLVPAQVAPTRSLGNPAPLICSNIADTRRTES